MNAMIGRKRVIMIKMIVWWYDKWW